MTAKKKPRFEFTAHAVYRFQERVLPELSVLQADTELKKAARGAKFVPTMTYHGQRVWELPTQKLAWLVTKEENNHEVVVTVLGANESREIGAMRVAQLKKDCATVEEARKLLKSARLHYLDRLKSARIKLQKEIDSILKKCPEQARCVLREEAQRPAEGEE